MDKFIFQTLRQLSLLSLLASFGYLSSYLYEVGYITYFGVPADLVQVEFKNFIFFLILIGIIGLVHLLVYFTIILKIIIKIPPKYIITIMKLLIGLPMLASLIIFKYDLIWIIASVAFLSLDIIYNFFSIRKLLSIDEITKQVKNKTISNESVRSVNLISTITRNILTIFLVPWILLMFFLPINIGKLHAMNRNYKCQNIDGFWLVRSYESYSLYVSTLDPNSQDRQIEVVPTSEQSINCNEKNPQS